MPTSNADSSYVQVSAGSTSFVGPDAVSLYRAVALKSAIGLYQKCGMIPTRGMTISRMLASAGQITGKPYKRGQAGAAIEDLTVWIETMKAALPVVTQ